MALSDRRSAWRSSRIAQAASQGVQHRHASDVLPDVEGDLPRLVNHEGRTMHQLSEHGADPAPFGGMAHRAQLAGHAQLPDQPQYVVGQLGEVQDQVVGGELARRQPL